ncbi:serine/threonine-protein kinase VRK3 [Phaenicophaeus curvirostris]|uniref:serine/threonine-protein kinase VRK3 n=1 Tax=Phaenicophaeus curvirostris TaxID=33595 RepID=UPI0037F09709
MRGGGRRGRGRGRGRGGRQPELSPPPAAAEPELEPGAGPEAGGASPGETRFCPRCGRGVEPAFRFCPGCGAALPGRGPREQQPPERPREEPPPPPPGPAASPATPGPAASPATPGPAAPRGPRSPRRPRPGPAEPLPPGTALSDRGGRVWSLRRLLRRGGGDLYEAQSASGSCPPKQRYFLKLDVKDGKIYNEQNFFQRAAKAGTVEKWKKSYSVPLLGIPSCLGFGLHADSYRFLVFPELGRTLQSVLNDGFQLLREKAAFQIMVRLLDCLEYIHENEYVHGDITAENVYLNPADLAQVTLAGYYFAFRYCPEGKHVAYREGSRTPHEGTVEFLSLDGHKGTGPSRRSDLESLGYCLLKWLCGFLPWSDVLDKVETVVEKKEKYKEDVKCLLQLCFRQRPIPDALQSYLQQVMALGYEERPDYEALRQLFRKPLERMKASAYDPVDIKMVP